jgi:anti-sigma factor RsiW
MAEPRVVGGVSCFEVLARLSDYVDGTLDADTKARVEAHLAGCDACTAFGTEFSAVLASARRLLGEKPAR